VTPDQVRAELAGSLPPATLVRGAAAWPLVCQAAGDSWLLAGELSAATAREARERALLLPSAGGLRVICLRMDEASEQVQNMLLKILEEPPDSTRFILVTVGGLLPTVASRCRVLVLDGAADPEEFEPADLAAVSGAVKAAIAGRTAELTRAVRGFSPACVAVLRVFAVEAASLNWSRFGPDYAPGVTQGQAVRLLGELSLREGAKLGPQVALARVFSAG
jgi:hypothetical protein